MISAMPAVAVRRERKKQRAAAAAASSRRSSLSSLPSPSTRSSSLLSSPLTPGPGGYYNYFSAQRPAGRRPSSVSVASSGVAGPATPATAAPPSRRPSASGVSTISSAASNYAVALHRVRERRLELRRERARFLAYTGSVLLASGAVLAAIGLAARAAPAQTVGLLFACAGCALCAARALCLSPREAELPLVRRGPPSGQSICAPPSCATTPGTDDSSTTSSYYFSAVPLHRPPPPPLQSPPSAAAPATPPRPTPCVGGPASGAVGGGHRGNPLLTPMSLDSIPEMQVLITDDSQRY